ncbi:tetratricopeptide repeat protein [Vandammella animalimorsus]|uniref:Tetratricopeptide repeat protein n=1 Tax=Vandammella animalimorsus TaxID=2029117 RepID=A0A2A2AHS3_9BURK|nr:hypothetical protein [Vandammella animalimorsus]PAT37304.1 hypothetical protein CK625_06740 [Vandammella animalimorsus]
MWDRIKQLWNKAPRPPQTLQLPEQEQRRLLAQAQQALEQGQYAQAERQAHELAGSSIDELSEQGMRLLGLVYFHQQQYLQAWPIFQKLAQRTGSVNDWFNVVTSATLAGEIAQGASAFESALKAHDSSDDNPALSAASLHLYYACALRDRGEHAKAFEHVQVLRALYEKLPQTDAHTLELRNFPRLDAVLDMMADVLAHSGDIPEAEAWLRSFGQQLKGGNVHRDIAQAIERLHRNAPPAPAAQAAEADAAPAAAPAPEPTPAASAPSADTGAAQQSLPLERQDKEPRLD